MHHDKVQPVIGVTCLCLYCCLPLSLAPAMEKQRNVHEVHIHLMGTDRWFLKCIYFFTLWWLSHSFSSEHLSHCLKADAWSMQECHSMCVTIDLCNVIQTPWIPLIPPMLTLAINWDYILIYLIITEALELKTWPLGQLYKEWPCLKRTSLIWIQQCFNYTFSFFSMEHEMILV